MPGEPDPFWLVDTEILNYSTVELIENLSKAKEYLSDPFKYDAAILSQILIVARNHLHSLQQERHKLNPKA